MTPFSSLPISDKILKVLEELKFTSMTPIQEKALPVLFEGKDFLGKSKTGSGKTAAFAIPILQKLSLQDRFVQALVICPTRELSSQVAIEIRKLGRKFEGLQVLLVAGGLPSRPQVEALQNGVHIVVGTSGRMLDLLERRALDVGSVRTLVMDEADKLLEMGFEDEISAIVERLPTDRQNVFFSATLPVGIQNLSRRYQNNPVFVEIEDKEESKISEIAYEIQSDEKLNVLLRVLQQHPGKSTLIFCNQKATVGALVKTFIDMDVSSAALHGDLEQRERNKVMSMFRNGSYRILVATDVAARGLDIEHLDLVVNYDFPQSTEDYIHRIGRTGRAGRPGVAVTLVSPVNEVKIFEIEKARNIKLSRPNLGFKNQHGLGPSFSGAVMKTVWISGGRKDKLRPGDILGALTNEAAGFKSENIGKIEIQEKNSLVAISNDLAEQVVAHLREGKIKGRKFQVRLL